MSELLTQHRAKVLSLIPAGHTISTEASFNVPGATLYRVRTAVGRWVHCYREHPDGTLWQVKVNAEHWDRVMIGEDLFS